ncbi:DMT family transporter [Staphylococcus massiliensis]|uniref:DMT family transporter n=1 Tax=Staphylococcus massiliensis TaxID=555791 RepID=UPI001EE07DD2|nr:DMT family transporter [Staphylococcus massiliensis]MCG3399532.1 DMT family transporter [Staphylococcus massiliensis]
MNYIMYLACMLIWGLNFIAVKIQGTDASLEISLLYRSLIAFLLFLILFIIKGKNLNTKLNWLTVIGFGLCNFAISYLLLYYGTILSSSVLVTIIFSMKVITTPILISIIFKTNIAKKIYIGGSLGMLSVVVTLVPEFNNVSGDFILGVTLAILGTLITSIGDVFSLYNSEKNIDPVIANMVGMFSATILLLTISTVTNQNFIIPDKVSYWIGLLYLSIMASFVAWLFYLHLVKNIGASESSFMVAGFPAIGGIASIIIGESQLNIYLILGIVFAILGAHTALSKKNSK